jgi:hypothetical protein
MKFRMKHVLLLGSSRRIFESLKNNVDCELTILNTTNMLKPFYKDLYTQVITTKKFCKEDWIKIGVAINSIHPVHTVITVDDNYQEVAIAISKELSIKYPYSEKAIQILNNKYKMREHLQKTGFSNIFSNLLVDEKSLLDIFRKNDVDNVIVKPVNGSGSQNIHKVNIHSDINYFLNNTLKKTKEEYVVEPFLQGEEYSVETYSESGNHKVYCITCKFKDNNFVETGHIVPAPLLEAKKVKSIIKYVSSFLDSAMVTDGPSHTEIIIKKDKINIVESQPRLGGDKINDLYSYATGINILGLICRGLTGDKVFDLIPLFSYEIFEKYAFTCFLTTRKGIVKDIKIDSRLELESDLLGFNIGCEIGDILKEDNSSYGRIAQIWGATNTYEDALLYVKSALKYIRINIE